MLELPSHTLLQKKNFPDKREAGAAWAHHVKVLQKRFHLNGHSLIALDPQSQKLKQVRTVKMKRVFLFFNGQTIGFWSQTKKLVLLHAFIIDSDTLFNVYRQSLGNFNGVSTSLQKSIWYFSAIMQKYIGPFIRENISRGLYETRTPCIKGAKSTFTAYSTHG